MRLWRSGRVRRRSSGRRVGGDVGWSAGRNGCRRSARLGCGAAAAERIGLDVLVQELGRVELRAVARQELQLDLLGVRLHPLANLLCAMHWMPVEDEDDLLAVGLADEAIEEVD